MRRTLVVKPELCVACKRCIIECAVAHSESEDLYQASRQEPPPKSRVRMGVIKGSPAPLVCRNCKNAPCIKACPTEALSREDPDAPVLLDVELCTACGACVEACPFDAIRIDKEGKAAIKCDLCVRRLKRGERPACVAACLTGAVQLKEVGSS